jgi:hypothetical protein
MLLARLPAPLTIDAARRDVLQTALIFSITDISPSLPL